MKKSILVTGVSGSGKSSVCKELKKKGYRAYDIESMDGFFEMVDKKTGKVVVDYDHNDIESVKQADWICDVKKLKDLIHNSAEGISFYCGTASNMDDILPFFDKVFLLVTNLEVNRKRLTERETKEFGKAQAVQDWIFSWKNWWENEMKEKGAIVIDANGTAEQVTASILKTL